MSGYQAVPAGGAGLLAGGVAAEEAAPWAGVRVVVIRDVAHVAIDPELPELLCGDFTQAVAHVLDVHRWRRHPVVPPDDHGHVAHVALGDPADVVLVIPTRHALGTAQIAVGHTGKSLIVHGST
jgi:hypothetical protein